MRFPRRALPPFLLALVLVFTLAAPTFASTGSGTTRTPIRIMVQGDSISHGSSGDLTWRWFLDRHLRGTPVDMVGPRQGPWGGDTANPEVPGVYADPSFDSDHAATWGDSLALPRLPVHATTAAHRPDVVVLILGTNDLAWLSVSPPDLVRLTAERIADIRAAAPGVDVVVGDVPLPSRADAREFNALLPELMTQLDTPAERVVLAPLSTGYTEGMATDASQESTPGFTYDPAHPNSQGQQHIAAAVADALARIGVGRSYPRPLVRQPETSLPWREVTVRPSIDRLRLSWTRPEGTTSADIWRRIDAGSWQRLSRSNTGWSWQETGLRACSSHEFRLRSRKGWTLTDDFSPTVRATVGPQAASPVGATISPRVHGADVRWNASPTACSTRVLWSWRTPVGASATRTDVIPAGVTTARLGNVPAGSRVSAAIEFSGGQGSRGTSRLMHVTAATVGLGARVSAMSVTRRRVTARWVPPAGASAVQVQVRLSGRWKAVSTVAPGVRQHVIGGLRPRTRVGIRVRFLDGSVRGPWSVTRTVTTKR